MRPKGLLIALIFVYYCSNAWCFTQSTMTLSVARGTVASTSVGNYALFGGGVESDQDSNVVDIYNTKTNIWSIYNFAHRRTGVAATSVGRYALFAGGIQSLNSLAPTFDDVDIFDSVTSTWSNATLSEARYQIAATSVGKYALFGGGYPRSSVVDIFNSETLEWTNATLSVGRSSLVATTAGRYAFFAGGYNGSSALLSTVDIFDSITGTWSTSDLSAPRELLFATSVGNFALFAGGRKGTAYYDVVDIYDTVSQTWSTTLNLASTRALGAATTVGNVALFGGGYIYLQGAQSLVDVFQFDQSNTNYTFTASQANLNLSRYYLSATTVGPLAMFAGGYSPSISNLIDVFNFSSQFDPATKPSYNIVPILECIDQDGIAHFGYRNNEAKTVVLSQLSRNYLYPYYVFPVITFTPGRSPYYPLNPGRIPLKAFGSFTWHLDNFTLNFEYNGTSHTCPPDPEPEIPIQAPIDDASPSTGSPITAPSDNSSPSSGSPNAPIATPSEPMSAMPSNVPRSNSIPIAVSSAVIRQVSFYAMAIFMFKNEPRPTQRKRKKEMINISNWRMVSWCGSVSLEFYDGKYLSPCFLDSFPTIVACIYFIIVGSIRLRSIQKYPAHPNKLRGQQIFEIVLVALTIFLILLLTIIEKTTAVTYAARIFSRLAVSGTWGYCLYIMTKQYKRNLKHNWTLKSYWLIMFLNEAFQMQSSIAHQEYDARLAHSILVFINLTVLCVTTLFTSGPPPLVFNDIKDVTDMTPEEREIFEQNEILDKNTKDNIKSEASASILNRLLMIWIMPLLRRGYRRALKVVDIPPLAVKDTTHIQSQVGNIVWQNEKAIGGEYPLIRTLWKTVGWKYALNGVFRLVNIFLKFAPPFFLRKIILFINNEEEPVWYGSLLVLVLLVISVLYFITLNYDNRITAQIQMNARAILYGLLYNKIFLLNRTARQKTSDGELIARYSVDADKIQNDTSYLHSVWGVPLQILISTIMLWDMLGPSSLVGVLVMILMLPINYKIAQNMGGLQKDVMKAKDERTTLTNEVMAAVRIIKYFAWEIPFIKKINDARLREIESLKRTFKMQSILSFCADITPILVVLFTFIVYSASGNDLTADAAFVSIYIFTRMRIPLSLAPTAITKLIQLSVSLTRIQTLLLAEEFDDQLKPATLDENSNLSIAMDHATFAWTSDARPCIKDITMHIKKGELVAVVGSVGAGKSSLLMALLGELHKVDGSVCMQGNFSYASQQAWIQNATLRDNIIIDGDIDDRRYEDVLQVCELMPDLEILPAGDLTEIGEKGINLSGGQKQRINLARAVYQDRDIYLLDDPLSAVDAHVSAAIFDNCISRYLHGKTRIVVTNQLQYLSRTDRIIVLDEGRLAETGSYEELMNSGGNFSQLMEKLELKTNNNNSSKEQPVQKEDKKVKKEGNATTSKIIKDEDRSVGDVDANIYNYYITMMGVGSFIVLLVLCLGSSSMPVISDWWLSNWTDGVQNHKHTTSYYISGFILISIISITIAFGSSIGVIFAGLNASKKIHLEMLQRVLRAPMNFFDSTPLGRIINRFTSDLDTIDNNLPGIVKNSITGVFSVIMSIFAVALITPFFLVFIIPLAFILQQLQRYYTRSSREIRRLQMISKSPIMSHFTETLHGLVSIRAFKKQKLFIARNEEIIDQSMRIEDIARAIRRWFFLYNEIIGVIILAAVGFFVVMARGSIDAGLAGFALICATNIPNYISDLVIMFSSIESELISVERCQNFTKMQTEADPVIDPRPNDAWPNKGIITFDHVTLRYREGLPLALADVTCQIQSHEKIGIVGRTGAGKSSLLTALLRICELTSGKIMIDDIDISTIGLHDLRSRIAIIPQDPTLFKGTIRSNLDPFNENTDDEIWAASRSVNLINQIENLPGKCDAPVAQNGDNLSAGTKQLLCLARAILRRPKVLILDEATASVDYETDAVIQKTIRTQFRDATVLTIAHRINTVLDSDRVMVMDQGRLVEFDSPQKLAQDPNSMFYSLVQKSLTLK